MYDSDIHVFFLGKNCNPNEYIFILKALTKQINSLPLDVYLVVRYLCVYLSLLKRCLHSSASLVYRKCNKKTVAEGVASLMSLLFPINWRSGVRMVTMIVFVNQLLLMRAGDVERNPGPGKRRKMHVTHAEQCDRHNICVYKCKM